MPERPNVRSWIARNLASMTVVLTLCTLVLVMGTAMLSAITVMAQQDDSQTYLPIISNVVSKVTPSPASPVPTEVEDSPTPSSTAQATASVSPTAPLSPTPKASSTAASTSTSIATSSRTAQATLTPASTATPTKQATIMPSPTATSPSATPSATPSAAGNGFIVLGWNDLGMHCYNKDFKDLAVLPPFNTLWAQVIKRGDPPQIVTDTVKIEYSFPDNTYSVGKSNFWEYDQQLFGVDLPADVGLAGKGLAGEMDATNTHFTAEGIPLTEFSDSNPQQPDPYQLAELVVKTLEGLELTHSTVVAPVSTEMHCDNCHHDGGVEDIRTGSVEQNILTLHDKENSRKYPAGHTGKLMDRRPILCAECHSSNALGAPGVSGLPSLSKAMHEKHAGKVQNSTEGCYNCHPGPTTKCLRDVMSSQFNMGCTDCHGDMEQVASNRNPWLNEPRCDNCHKDPKYAQNNPLFRMSTGHGGVYCEGCHDSTHAIAPSSQGKDAIKFIELQGHGGPIDTCTVCHVTSPGGGSPHDVSTTQ